MDEPSSIYMIGLLYESEPEISQAEVLDRLNARIGNVDPMGDDLIFAFLDYEVIYAGGKGLPAQAIMMLDDIVANADDDPDHDIVQSWFWPEAVKVVPRCRSVLHINDFMASGLPHKKRLALFHNVVMSVLDVAPCSAIHWMPSQQYIDPDAYIRTKDTPTPDPIYPAVNVRYYDVGTAAKPEAIMDSVGFWALGGVDAQCRFTGLDPDDVAGIVGNVALYLFEHGDIIEDGETIEGVGTGSRWLCHHEESSMPPDRTVIDIAPGPTHAAGNRN